MTLADDLKRRAAAKALEQVMDGMKLGLGTGSTAAHFVALLGEKVAQGLKVVGVPTSVQTHKQAESLNIPLTTLDETPELDITIDGADEFDGQMRLIKGGGGALLREKIVAASSDRMIVIADPSKKVDALGAFPLPVEVVTFGAEATSRRLARLVQQYRTIQEVAIVLRMTGEAAFITDQGNYIYDCHFGRIDDVEGLAMALSTLPGVVDHGIFLNLASEVIYD